MFTLRNYAPNHKHETLLKRKRKRILRVREIIDHLGDNKHTATPELIMEALNKNGDNVCLSDASNALKVVLRLTATKSPYSLLTAYYWQSSCLRRFKDAVWKLGGIDIAKPDEILEAMRINDDNDYYLTIDDVKSKLKVYRDFLEHPYSGSIGAGHAPLGDDDSDSLSRKFEEKLILGEKKIGGPVRRALRGGNENNSNSWYKKKIESCGH